ncbi:MAG: class I SAM-dependent methyltransferase [Candidatus Scalinduaceae bacterium]
MKIVEWLRLREAGNIDDLDKPSTTLLRTKIIQQKLFLRKLYIDFYNQFKMSISDNIESKFLVELGSGGGFIKDIIPNVMTSDVINIPTVDKRFLAQDMPFENNTVDAFFMVDVLHHINNTRAFFKEANRCLKVSGKIVMVEPANTLWGRFIYKHFHHEPFDPSGEWGIKEGEGPLSSANGAIPWIIFCRDREQFEKEFPSFKILKLKPHTPFLYLVSGGLTMRQLLPSFTYSIVKGLETILLPLNKYLGMFLTVEIGKVS